MVYNSTSLIEAAQVFASIPRKKDDPNRIDYPELPYGVWSIPGEYEVIFNRKYKGIWTRTPDGSYERAEHCPITKFLEDDDICNQEWFIESDCKNPRKDPKYWERSERILLDFITGRSIRKHIVH